EFLTGFRKRKNERRSRAKADLERNLKEERVRIRQEVKDGFKHMKKSFEPLRELTEADKLEAGTEDAYEDDEVQVKIVELSTNEMAAQRNMLGTNTADDSDEEEVAPEESENEGQQTNLIPGMDFDINAKRKRKAGTDDEEEEGSRWNQTQRDIKSKKELDKLMKTKTLKKMKKSKLFKMKERMDKKANLKKTIRDRNNTIKNVPKHHRTKLKHGKAQIGNPTRYRKGRMIDKKSLRRKHGAD
ncbi:vito, partial [Drosophila busckii]